MKAPMTTLLRTLQSVLVLVGLQLTLAQAVLASGSIDRRHCRHWAETHASRAAFAERIERWLLAELAPGSSGVGFGGGR